MYMLLFYCPFSFMSKCLFTLNLSFFLFFFNLYSFSYPDFHSIVVFLYKATFLPPPNICFPLIN